MQKNINPAERSSEDNNVSGIQETQQNKDNWFELCAEEAIEQFADALEELSK
jgi:hypothetical protein